MPLTPCAAATGCSRQTLLGGEDRRFERLSSKQDATDAV
jgi:hypothetical protein